MNISSKVNRRFTFSVTLGLFFLHKCWILGWMFDLPSSSSSSTDRYWKFFCGIPYFVLINSTISVKPLEMFYGTLFGKRCSEQWQGQFENNALYSYQWMQPHYRYKWEIRGHENLDGIDAMELRGNEGKTKHMLKDIWSK